ncbi:MAG: hypothetical protein V4724_39040 [Pseudomonadota bacterium]
MIQQCQQYQICAGDNALDDLPILFKLDVLHFEEVTNLALRRNILAEGVAMYPSDAPGSAPA